MNLQVRNSYIIQYFNTFQKYVSQYALYNTLFTLSSFKVSLFNSIKS